MDDWKPHIGVILNWIFRRFGAPDEAAELPDDVVYAVRVLEKLTADVEPTAYAFAVVMDGGRGQIVATYRERKFADEICRKQPAGHHDVVVPLFPVYFDRHG